MISDADTQPYWDGIARGELLIQHCGGCARAVFYPRVVCPHCMSAELEWRPAAGTGTVYSYTVAHQAYGEHADDVPFTVALVDLDEGVRMMTRIAGGDRPRIGRRVRIVFTDGALPYFTPVS